MSTTTATETVPATLARAPKKERILALDVLRGLTLVCMVLVNSPGDPKQTCAVLKHVTWHGWALADLVFPFFLFMVGAAIPYSTDGRLARGDSERRILLDALRRAVTLFAIGLAMNWYAKLDFANWGPSLEFGRLRFFNVLQRIGICYFIAMAMHLRWKPRTQAIFAASVLVSYFVLMKFVPVPGHGAGVLDQVGNWAQYIDANVMGTHCGSNYKGDFFETKGLLATLPALVTTLLGVWTGRMLRQPGTAPEKLMRLYFFGTTGMLLGACWDPIFPMGTSGNYLSEPQCGLWFSFWWFVSHGISWGG
jgi:predicted acyltransferase